MSNYIFLTISWIKSVA